MSQTPRHPVAQATEEARLDLALHLETLPPPARIEAAHAAVIETGGTFSPASDGRHRNAHYAELSLLGIYQQGADMDEAIRHWIKSVLRCHTCEKDAA